MNEDEMSEIVEIVQIGDYNAIREALRRKIAVGCSRDKDGCSLLQWAAINNRCAIANLLIDNGADISYAGGLLMENALQWAVRRKYYKMVELLARKGQNVLGHRSNEGSDAIGIAHSQGEQCQ